MKEDRCWEKQQVFVEVSLPKPCGGLLEAWRAMELCERLLIPSALVKDVLCMLCWLPAAALSSSSSA